MPRFGPKDANEEQIFAIENLRADLQQVIYWTMERNKVSRKELARRLDCSAAYVTQLLSEDSNPTVETVARIFHALGGEVKISSQAFDDARSQRTAESCIETFVQLLADRRDYFLEDYSAWLEERDLVGRDTAYAADTNYRRYGRNSAEYVMHALRRSYEEPQRQSRAISNHNEISFEISDEAAEAA